MIDKYKFQIIEIILIFGIATLTLLFQFLNKIPLPLLAIPFAVIISIRSIFAILEDST